MLIIGTFSFDTCSIYHHLIQEPVMIQTKKAEFSAAAAVILLLFASCASFQSKTGVKTEEPVQQKKSNQTIQQMILAGKSSEAKELFQAKIDINSIDKDGNTALHAAAQINDSELVTFLIYKGANTELKNHQGDTALHLAIKNKGKESSKILAAANSTLFARDGQNKTALEIALSNGQEFYDVVITTKTGQMRDVNGRSIIHYIVDWENTSALDYAIQKKIPISVEDNKGVSPLALAYSKNNSLESIKIAASLIMANASPLRGYFSYFEDSVKTRNPNLRFDDGQTPLHFASIFGHTAIAQYLLERGAQTKVKDILGSSPLHEACRYGQSEIVLLLLKAGSDPNSQDSLGKTPLLLVIENNKRLEIYDLLLKYKANPNAMDMYGDTPLHIAAMNSMDMSVMQLLHQYGADVNGRNKQGITPLALSIERQRKEHVEFLTQRGADIHAEDIQGRSPLSRVLSPAQNTTMTEMLQILVNSNNISSRDSYGNTALHLAVENNASMEQVKYLLSLTGNVDDRNKNGDSPLLIAVQKNRRGIGELLLAKKADVFSTNNENYSPIRLALMAGGDVQEWILTSEVIKSADGTGNTPLHYAAEWKLDNACSVLLEKGANANARNANGETPLFNAVKANTTTTIDLLVKHGADKEIRDFLGNTPLHACVRWDAKNSAMKLIQLKSDLNALNLAGKTPLSQAARSSRIAMVNLLLENGANIDAYDATGRTILMDAIQSGNASIVSLLLRKGASPLIQEMYGRNAYHEAAESGNLELIKLIQEAGGNPLSRDTYGTTPFSLVLGQNETVIKTVLGTNQRLIDSDGNTPLHIALDKKADTAVLSLLLSMNYPVNTRNREGITPLVIAAKNGMKEQVQLLIERGADIYLSDNSGESAVSYALTKQTDLLDSIVKYAGTKVDIAGEGILHYAARLADISVLQKILGMGLDRQLRNISGETPREIAIRWQRMEASEILR